MGVDFLDLLFQLEGRFNIRISTERLEQVRTVADVRDVVAELLPSSLSDSAPGATTFYRLRRHLVEHCGCDRADVRPSAQMTDLFSKNRYERWRALRKFSPGIPILGSSRVLNSLRGAALLVFAGALIVGVRVASTPLYLGMRAGIFACCATLLAGGVALYGLYRFTATLDRAIPSQLATVRDIVRVCVPAFKPSADAPVDDHLMLEVRRILAEITGVPVEKITPQSLLIKDLGMD